MLKIEILFFDTVVSRLVVDSEFGALFTHLLLTSWALLFTFVIEVTRLSQIVVTN